MDSVSASIIAGGIITPVLKFAVGRSRPRETSGTYVFKPFSAHQSFPSGHATQAFAVATVIASHYTEWWEQTLAYGAAGLVGVGRIQQNAHFASDVVAGSAIGWAVGRAVVHRHDTPSHSAVTMSPWLGRGAGLVINDNF
jgi:membrane-associated phospholipid phosphatase